MLVDFQERVRSALAAALQDQKASNDARTLERAAFQSAVDAVLAQATTDAELKKRLATALEAMKQEQHDDERGAEIMTRSVAAALSKVAELASL